MQAYHDQEWGRLPAGDRVLFEQMVLVTFQAGLSWELILKKRPALREAFVDFDPQRIAGLGEIEVAAMLANPAIIRNQAKIRALINNAARFLEVQAECGSFYAYLRRFGPDLPHPDQPAAAVELSSSPYSEALAEDLRRRGFRFLGAITCHSYLESVGLLGNPHQAACFLGPAINP